MINTPFFSFTQNVYHVETRNRDTVTNLDSAIYKLNPRILILLETDSFTVLTKYSVFITHFEKWIKEYPDIDGDSILLQKILQDTSKYIVHGNILANTPLLNKRLIYRISDLIEKGDCFIYNKSIRRIEKIIIVEHWWTFDSKGRPAGNVGKIFKTLKNMLVLKTYDGAN